MAPSRTRSAAWTSAVVLSGGLLVTRVEPLTRGPAPGFAPQQPLGPQGGSPRGLFRFSERTEPKTPNKRKKKKGSSAAAAAASTARAATVVEPESLARRPAPPLEEGEDPPEDSLQPSLFEVPPDDSDALEVVAATEEALELTRFRAPRGVSSQRIEEHENARWDGLFWREFDEERWIAECETDAAKRRLTHFFRLHRILSLTASGTNHTAVTLFRSPSTTAPTLTDASSGRVAVAFWAYPGLAGAHDGADDSLAARLPWGFDAVGDPGAFETWVAEALPSVEVLSAKLAEDGRERRRLERLFPPKPADPEHDALIKSFVDMRPGLESFRTSTGEYGELVDERPQEDDDQDYGSADATDASIEATFRALEADGLVDPLEDDDDDDDDLSADRRRRLRRKDEEIDEAVRLRKKDVDDLDDLFGSYAEDDEALGFDDGSDDAAMPPRMPQRPAYERVVLKSDGRVDPFAADEFETLVAALPGGHRDDDGASSSSSSTPSLVSAYLVRVAPGAAPPLASTRRPHLVTAYVRLTPSTAAGLRVADAVDDGTVVERPVDRLAVLDGSYLHAPYNDDAEDALFLVLEYYHPDLTEPERRALDAFFALDEQFLLRRFNPLDVLPVVLNADLGDWWWTPPAHAQDSRVARGDLFDDDDDDDDPLFGGAAPSIFDDGRRSSSSSRGRRVDRVDFDEEFDALFNTGSSGRRDPLFDDDDENPASSLGGADDDDAFLAALVGSGASSSASSQRAPPPRRSSDADDIDYDEDPLFGDFDEPGFDDD